MKLTIIAVILIIYMIVAMANSTGFGWIRKILPKKKKEQSKNPVMEILESTLKEHTSVARRHKKEKLYLQAGLKLNYTQGILIGLIIGIAGFVAMQVALDNMILSLFMFLVGNMLPDMVITMIKNRKDIHINNQVGSFFTMILKRFEVLGDFYKAFIATKDDFVGEDPMYSELDRAVSNIENGMPLTKALREIGERLDNKYLIRFADYYAVAAEIGTEEARNNILNQAVAQYQKNEENMRSMRKQLRELTMEAYVMVAVIPIIIAYSCVTQHDYITFVTTTLLGKVGLSAVIIITAGIFWFVNKKVGAPLDKD
ncbi:MULTISPECIES: type II secretion system F family protein [Clostridia]|uniref:type II secretion system F family protein n=1 Tax=Clostridia TaxID=186801 RepID=UPI000E4E0253|nr:MULTISPECIES: type II secretion system F family protein [Clostridia]RHV70293.1 hypothetical protein DXB15_08305 [Roseburia sp. OM02-15]